MRPTLTSMILALMTIVGISCDIAQAQLISGRSHSTTLHLPETDSDIRIRCTTVVDGGDEGFRTLIFTASGRTTRIVAKNRVAYLATRTQVGGIKPSDPIHGLTIDHSRLFFTGRYNSEGKTHTILAFIGEPVINGSRLLLVGFHDDGTAFKLLEFEEFNLYSFEQEVDGVALLIGKQSLSEVMLGEGFQGDKKPYATTYDPSSVYVLKPNLPAAYSLEESKRYNEQHYVWAGPKSREDFAVVWNVKGKPNPFGVPAKQLDAIMATAAKK